MPPGRHGVQGDFHIYLKFRFRFDGEQSEQVLEYERLREFGGAAPAAVGAVRRPVEVVGCPGQYAGPIERHAEGGARCPGPAAVITGLAAPPPPGSRWPGVRAPRRPSGAGPRAG